ncbi:hypothetical protein KR009_002697 [Drosophila setifemur]|nr:hypothetical protein KR009_002697 [Drosophila setifemur]
MDPAVLVLSYGATSPVEIIEGILTEMKQPKDPTSEECSLNCYKCKIKNKYYNISTNLIPFNGKLENVPEDILKATEALIIFFDPKEVSKNIRDILLKLLSIILNIFQTAFIDTISKTLSKNEQIQLGFLLTYTSPGEESGISLSDLKERTNYFFDVITLKSNSLSDSEESENGYEEIVEGLQNVVWSTVNFGSKSDHKEMNADELDSQLKDFENLLLTAQSLRNDTSLTREQFLDRAEQFAGIVSSIMNDNDSD